MAGALGAAHAAGVLHRDLKPENLLIGPFGEVELGDFGIAAVEGASRTTTGHASFTASHVAPEILRRRRPDERADLYSLASTLYTLVAGSPPFAGRAGEPIEAVLTSVLTDPPPRLQGVPASLADLLHQTLSKDPRDRPTSAEVFGRILQRVQAEGGGAVTELRLTPTGNVAPTVDPPTADPAPAGGDPRPTVHRPPASPPRGDPLPTVVAAPPPSTSLRPAVAAAGAPRADGPGSPSGGAAPAPVRERTRRRRTILGAAVGATALAAVLLLATRGGGGTGRSSDTTAPDFVGSAATTDTVPPGTDPAAGTTAATIAPVSELPVLVVNASGLTGAASAVTATLTEFGYSAALPPSGSAPAAQSTLIYYFADEQSDYRGDAEAVGRVLGIPPTQVVQMPADTLTEFGVDIANADVVVMVGADLAASL